MRVSGWWRVARMLMVAAVLGLALASRAGSLRPVAMATMDVPVALASVADDDRDGREDKNHKDNSDKGRDGDADHQTEGQVIGIDNLKDPPELMLGDVDGTMVVRVVKADEIARNGVRLCDYVTVQGEKINEQLFEATDISVDDHHC